MHFEKPKSDLKQLDRQYKESPTAERLAPKTREDVLPKASNAPQPQGNPHTLGNDAGEP
jgi:hypothetical protein